MATPTASPIGCHALATIAGRGGQQGAGDRHRARRRRRAVAGKQRASSPGTAASGASSSNGRHVWCAKRGRYDLVVVVAGSVHQQHHQKGVAAWATERRDALADVASGFISVSLTVAEDSEESRSATQRCIDDFCEHTGWSPGRIEPIAGALQYREYDFFTRQLMRLLMKKMDRARRAGMTATRRYENAYFRVCGSGRNRGPFPPRPLPCC